MLGLFFFLGISEPLDWKSNARKKRRLIDEVKECMGMVGVGEEHTEDRVRLLMRLPKRSIWKTKKKI